MKRRLKKDPRRRKTITRSRADRANLVASFRACASTDEKTRFLEDTGISRSSIFRWQRELVSFETHDSPDSERTVIDAIVTLCDKDHQPKWCMVDAIATFSAWLRWPSSPMERKSGTAVLHAAYLSHEFSDKPLAEFAREEIDGLLRCISPSRIARLLAGEDDSYADFREYSLPDIHYAERHLIEDIAAFLISEEQAEPSLNKAFYLVEGGAFGHHIIRSRRTFDVIWQRLSRAAPFYLVDRDDTLLSWHLDPFEENYAAYVNDIIKNSVERRAYFSKCAWVTKRLRERLSGRSRALNSLLTIPEQVGETPIICPALSHDVRERLAIYSRTRRPIRPLRRPRT